jgi:hypothetical protein
MKAISSAPHEMDVLRTGASSEIGLRLDHRYLHRNNDVPRTGKQENLT